MAQVAPTFKTNTLFASGFSLIIIALGMWGFRTGPAPEAVSTPSSPPGYFFGLIWSIIYIGLAFIFTYLTLNLIYLPKKANYMTGIAAAAMAAYIALLIMLYIWYPMFNQSPTSTGSRWWLGGSIGFLLLLWSLLLRMPVELLQGATSKDVSEYLKTASITLATVPAAWLLFAQQMSFETL